MKLEKDDFGIWDYILSLQDDLDRLLIKHDEVREELGDMKDKCEDMK